MEKLPNLNETDLRKMLAIDLDCEETLDLKDFDWKLLSAKLLEREKTLQHTDASQKNSKASEKLTNFESPADGNVLRFNCQPK